MLLVEAAGFDVVLVETVGVGQSETAVSEMVDLFVLLVSPGGGDDLQGIKRGVMELADLILVTKADGELEQRRQPRGRRLPGMALHLMRPKYPGIVSGVHAVSALDGTGIAEAWSAMAALHEALAEGGHLKRLRQEQAQRWFWSEVQAVLADAIAADPRTSEAAAPGRGRCHGGPASAACRRAGADRGLPGLSGPGQADSRPAAMLDACGSKPL